MTQSRTTSIKYSLIGLAMAAYAQAAPLISEAPIAGRKLSGYSIPNDDCCKLFENDNYGGVEK
jgi:hypothetical protein